MSAVHDLLLDLMTVAAQMRAMLDESPNDNPDWMGSEERRQVLALIASSGELLRGYLCDPSAEQGDAN